MKDVELTYPLYRCKEVKGRVMEPKTHLGFVQDGADAFTVGTKKGATHKGRHGYPMTVDFALDEIKSENLDGIIIPGGAHA